MVKIIFPDPPIAVGEGRGVGVGIDVSVAVAEGTIVAVTVEVGDRVLVGVIMSGIFVGVLSTGLVVLGMFTVQAGKRVTNINRAINLYWIIRNTAFSLHWH